jgi:hypothetical protein
MALVISSDWDDENLRDLGEFTNSFIDDCFAFSGVSADDDTTNSMGSTNVGDEINIESLPQQSSRIYTVSYTSTVSK